MSGAPDPESEFRRRLRTPGAPVSTAGAYAAGAALVAFGAATAWISLSSAMFWSGWLIIALGLAIVAYAVRTRR